jgi:nicotinate-nucleotide pyrophosphorylase (carboxylating)
LRELAPPPRLVWEKVLRRGLEEDLGEAGDLTSQAVVPASLRASARLVARRAGRLAGLDMALATFSILDPEARFDQRAGDGEEVDSGQLLAVIEGDARALLGAERTALNLLGRLSGIATATRELVRLVAPWGTTIVCTRKTTPGLRALEKYAVRAGGGANHRFGLDDGILIKDNHLVLAGDIETAVNRARAASGHMVRIEVEVEDLEQLDAALRLGVDAVLLDNMPLDVLREAVLRAQGRATTEASGGVDRQSVAEVAATGVDLISAGVLTHSAPALDVALDALEPAVHVRAVAAPES